MGAVDTLEELKALGSPPSIRLHKLKGDKKNTWAIDIFKTLTSREFQYHI